MRNFTRFRKSLAVATLLSVVAASFAVAQTVPRYFNARQYPEQLTHYLRFTVNYNSCVLASGSCVFQVKAVPYNAWIMRAEQQIITSFNSGTTDTVAIGVTSTSANELVAAQSVHGAAGGATDLTVVSTNRGTVVTGDGATQTNAIGGFGIWVKYAQTGAAPTAGQATYLIEYAAPNDGACVDTPLGATNPAC